MSLQQLSKLAGIDVAWTDAHGAPKTVSEDVQRVILEKLGYPAGTDEQTRDSLKRLKAEQAAPPALRVVRPGATIVARGKTARFLDETGSRRDSPVKGGNAAAPKEPGYYSLDATGERIAVVPPKAWGLSRKRLWAIAAQLYSLRGSGAFGDFGALADFVAQAAQQGASAVAISPVHALFGALPDHISPYSPSTRLFLNPLYASLAAPDAGAELVDWEKAGPAKIRALKRRFQREGSTPALETFIRAGGQRLLNHAWFEVLDSRFRKRGLNSWREWPAEFRNSSSPAVRRLKRDEPDVAFQLYLQFCAERDLARAQAAATGAGMSIGLITDMAVGMDPAGSHAWSAPDEVLPALSIGAPPDIYNSAGQNWGLTNFSPQGLLRSGFAGFIATLRAAMRHAGGIRLDHAMGLQRLWVVPEGADARDGAYLRYPLTEMLGLLTLESQRHHALVIAEDLGTVPPGFRERISRANILGMRVLWFERDHKGRFLSPDQWDRHAAALSTTHDLPTIAGWWRGRDIAWRKTIGAPAKQVRAEKAERARDKTALWKTLRTAGCLEGQPTGPRAADRFAEGAISALASTPCPLLVVPLEDLTGAVEQPNIPGTIQEHPNWRRRLDSAEPLASAPARRRIAILNQKRP